MHRHFWFFLLAMACSPERLSAQISGRVVFLEKGGVERKATKDVLVYLEDVDVDAPAGTEATASTVTITSKNKKFEPRATAVIVGMGVEFPNLDDIMHNVFSISKGNRFDLGLYKSGAKKDFVFEKAGLVRVYCNIHPHMSACVQVLPNAYYGWVADDGSFRIDDVPPGNYSLAAWHEQGSTRKPVVVTEQGASGVRIELDVSKYRRRPHLNKFGKPYKRKRGKY